MIQFILFSIEVVFRQKFLPKNSWQVRDGVKKSKWKFKIAFAMKGGGGLEGVSSATYLF